MKTTDVSKQRFLFLAILFFLLLPAITFAQTCIAQRYLSSSFATLAGTWATSACILPFVCTAVTTTPVQTAINASQTNNAIKVTGTCAENLSITEATTRIVLDGQGSAALVGAAANSTIAINGSAGITIRNFLSISGGNTGILVNRGAAAVIVSNTIENNNNGIRVEDGATARIGINSGNDTVASPNIIQNNTRNGIFVNRASSAHIVGNTISGNGTAGVSVTKVS